MRAPQHSVSEGQTELTEDLILQNEKEGSGAGVVESQRVLDRFLEDSVVAANEVEEHKATSLRKDGTSRNNCEELHAISGAASLRSSVRASPSDPLSRLVEVSPPVRDPLRSKTLSGGGGLRGGSGTGVKSPSASPYGRHALPPVVMAVSQGRDGESGDRKGTSTPGNRVMPVWTPKGVGLDPSRGVGRQVQGGGSGGAASSDVETNGPWWGAAKRTPSSGTSTSYPVTAITERKHVPDQLKIMGWFCGCTCTRDWSALEEEEQEQRRRGRAQECERRQRQELELDLAK